MNKIIIGLCVAAVLVVGSILALTIRERDAALEEGKKAKAKVLETETQLKNAETAKTTMAKEKDEALAQATKATALMKEMEKRAVSAEEQLAKAEANAAKGGRFYGKGDAIGAPGNAKPMKAMADMMKDPAMKEMIKQQQLAQLDIQYGNLFDRFQLNDQERSNLKQIIAERTQAEMELGLSFMGGDSLTKEKREAMVNDLNKAKAASDEKIKTFLNNDDDYKTFQNWEETKPERMQLTLGQAAFTSAGEPLSSDQEEQLVAAMHAARTQAKDLPDMTKPENANPANLSPAMLDKIMASFDQQSQVVIANAAKFLSPKQLEGLKAMQKQQKAMQEAGLKMSSMMFGGKK